MLGEKIGEEHGKVTGRRVLPGDAVRSFVKMEISFETEATVYGIACTNIGTYEVYERGPGQMYGEGQGILMTADGEGAIWNGHGVGRPDESGAIAFAAAIAIQTDSSKLAALNGVMVVVEHKTDMAGSASSELWEWKA